MNDLDAAAFAHLFTEAHQKCFGHPMTDPLSETESKQFSNKVFDQTGLVIGPKSIKNYSAYVINNGNGKEENPSVATLDTLARYVLNAPYTDETQRKNRESHYPYWFQYKDQFYRQRKKPGKRRRLSPLAFGLVLAIIILGVVATFFLYGKSSPDQVIENFDSVVEDSLEAKGWMVQSKDSVWWNKRNEFPGHLSLFTLKGDNWPDSIETPVITNLLLRSIDADCFTTEIHLSDFIPGQNWQQAGILLSEDSSFNGKSLRLSIAYNDFFGGFKEKPQIIVQGITSQGKGSNPEEIVHKVLFTRDSTGQDILFNNMKRSALRIEKSGNRLRILYASSPVGNFAFKEAITQEFTIHPKYIGIFALKGRVDESAVIAARVDFFNFLEEKCDE
jgi:hypothetical protein